MINSDGIDILSLYNRVRVEYEKKIEGYSYKCNDLNDMECVYIIEDSFVVYIGVIDYSNEDSSDYYYIVIDELLDNSIFRFNYSGFLRSFPDKERFYIKYKKFHGIWAEPIRDISEIQYGIDTGMISPDYALNYQIDSKAEYVDRLLPDLKLKERFDEWEGYLYHFIVYELQEGNQKGYAIHYTTNPLFHKIARQKANDIEWCALAQYSWIVTHRPELLEGETAFSQKNANHESLYRGIYYDETIINLLIKRIDEQKKSGWVHKHQKKVKSLTLCIAEHDLKYFLLSKYVNPADVINVKNEVLSDVHYGKYSEEPRYEYLIPENKWKSEQLVYEIAKKLYRKKTVLYQHRPFFLKSEKGQMSYDVFICGLDVAIEYQGKQHFEPVEIFGGDERFKEQVIRDVLKQKLSEENGVALTYINYWEDISPELIKERIEEADKRRDDRYN